MRDEYQVLLYSSYSSSSGTICAKMRRERPDTSDIHFAWGVFRPCRMILSTNMTSLIRRTWLYDRFPRGQNTEKEIHYSVPTTSRTNISVVSMNEDSYFYRLLAALLRHAAVERTEVHLSSTSRSSLATASWGLSGGRRPRTPSIRELPPTTDPSHTD